MAQLLLNVLQHINYDHYFALQKIQLDCSLLPRHLGEGALHNLGFYLYTIL